MALGVENSSLWDRPPSKVGSKTSLVLKSDPETDTESTTSKGSKGVFYCVTGSPTTSNAGIVVTVGDGHSNHLSCFHSLDWAF